MSKPVLFRIQKCRVCGRPGISTGDGICLDCLNKRREKGRRTVAIGIDLHESRTLVSTLIGSPSTLILSARIRESTKKSVAEAYTIGAYFPTTLFIDHTFRKVAFDEKASIITLTGIMRENNLEEFQSFWFRSSSFSPEEVYTWLSGIGLDVGMMSEARELGILQPIKIKNAKKLHSTSTLSEAFLEDQLCLGFWRDLNGFVPNHFSSFWIDKNKGIQSIVGLPINSKTLQIQSIFFARKFMWTADAIREWFEMHPRYMSQAYSPKILEAQIQTRKLMLKGWRHKFTEVK